jgi:cation diffusion facilitator CzcD-associated flavoprotein CzcO
VDVLDVAIIGAGPYGLSLAAHLAARLRSVRVFGAPMRTWRTMMPPDMLLRSHWTETRLSAPGDKGTLQCWADEVGGARIEPVPLQTFLRYADWFRDRFVPDLDPADITHVEQAGGTFRLHTTAGDELDARRVVSAVGVTPFPRRLPQLAEVEQAGHVSLAIEHQQFGRFAGRRVLVVGGGQNGLESAALAHAAGAESVEVVVRSEVRWFRAREHWEQRGWAHERLFRLAYPIVGFGPPPINRLVLHPDLFSNLPVNVRERLNTRLLRPGGSPWVRDQVEGQIPVTVGVTVAGAREDDGEVVVDLSDGTQRHVDHLIVCVGYRFDLDALQWIDPALRSSIDTDDGWPALDRAFRSRSVPELAFIGYAAEHRFGPLSRFVAGTTFTSQRAASVL